MNSAQVSEKTGVCIRPRKDWSVGEAGGGRGGFVKALNVQSLMSSAGERCS